MYGPTPRRACVLTVELVASFGFSEQTLRADSALLPIAYYIFKRKPPENWLLHPAHADRPGFYPKLADPLASKVVRHLGQRPRYPADRFLRV